MNSLISPTCQPTTLSALLSIKMDTRVLAEGVLKDLSTFLSFFPIQSCLSQAPICDLPSILKCALPSYRAYTQTHLTLLRTSGPWFHNLYRQCHHQLSHNNPFCEGSHNLLYMMSLLSASSTQPLYQKIISDILRILRDCSHLPLHCHFKPMSRQLCFPIQTRVMIWRISWATKM